MKGKLILAGLITILALVLAVPVIYALPPTPIAAFRVKYDHVDVLMVDGVKIYRYEGELVYFDEDIGGIIKCYGFVFYAEDPVGQGIVIKEFYKLVDMEPEEVIEEEGVLQGMAFIIGDVLTDEGWSPVLLAYKVFN